MTTLARLSFWVPTDPAEAFETFFSRRLVPILQRHGLKEPRPDERPAVDGVFSRLFALASPRAVAEKAWALTNDPDWQDALRQAEDDSVPFVLRLYHTTAGPGKTAPAGPGTCQGLWQNLDVTCGLPAPAILDLLQDGQGSLWMTSWQGGLGRYDGREFTVFTTQDGLLANTAIALATDLNGHLWIGGAVGLCRYDGREFTVFTTQDELAGLHVSALCPDRHGHLWIGTSAGLCQYDGQRLTAFTEPHGPGHGWVNTLLEDRSGHLWIGTENGLYWYDGREFQAQQGLPAGSINTLLEDPDGDLWIGTGKGLYCRDGETVAPFIRQDALPHSEVKALCGDRCGHLWIGTAYGLCRYDGRHLTAQGGLPNPNINALIEDHSGHLWAATADGVGRYLGHQFTHFTVAEGLAHNTVFSLVESRDGHLWFGTKYGINRYDGETFFHHTTSDNPEDNWVWKIREDRQGQLWFSGAPLCRFDGRDFTRFSQDDGLPVTMAQAFCEDRHGHLWISLFRGHIYRWDGHRFICVTGDNPLATAVVCLLEDRQGRIWCGTHGKGGAYCYDGAGFHSMASFIDMNVNAILEDTEGRLWFGTDEGLFCYNGRDYIQYTTRDGLPHDHVSTLLQDRQGILWIGTWGGGVGLYDGQVFQQLRKSDGLVNNAIQEIIEDRHGVVWMATEGGVSCYRRLATVPTVRLLELRADRRYRLDQPLTLPATQKALRFEFAGYSLGTRSDGMAYLVRLRGLEENWKPVFTGSVDYEDLPVGDYTFQVRAVDRDLNYSETAQVRFTIEPDARLQSLTAALGQSGPQGEFVGHSPTLQRVQQQLRQVAPSELTVLILGETGTGKGLAARTLHQLCPRQDQPFVQVTCGAIPAALIESELFGHEKGAFTGATSRHLGRVELAEGGTLFLDEIGDMSLEAQIRLLRLLEEGTYERVGGTETLTANVRVVAATNRDLRRRVAEGTFRQDLYYRLRGFEIHLPPLRERKEDIPLLALYFIGPKAAHLDKPVRGLSQAAEAALVAHPWPGNVRELQNAIGSAVVVCRGEMIQVGDLMLGQASGAPSSSGGLATLEEMERHHIRAVLETTKGRVSGPRGAATILGMPESTLRSRMKKLGIEKNSLAT